MTQEPVSTEHTRPGRVVHLALTAAIFVYALVVELCESQLAPFDGFVPGMDFLSVLRVILALVALADLGVAFLFLWRPYLLRTVGAAFMLAYASLESLAIYGLVLFLLGGHRLDFYLFAAPALVGLLLLWAQAGRWDALIELEQYDLGTTGGENYD
jgi:hypothetical protein